MRPGLHERFELRAFACDQKLGGGIVEAGALQLADRRAQFEDLGSQLQNPVSVRVFIHGESPKASAARDRAHQLDVLLHGADAHPLAGIGQEIARGETSEARLTYDGLCFLKEAFARK